MIKRRPTFRVARDDKRDPLVRLLEDGLNPVSGLVEVHYDQQWRTLFRAQALGYVDDEQRLTAKGAAYRKAWIDSRPSAGEWHE